MAETAGRGAVVIEDDESIRDLISVILGKIGLEVTAVGDADQGIDAIRASEPAVVTLDINLPGIDGFEAAQRIREISDAYVVIITARDEEIDTLQGLGAGADDYVVKPFRPRELRARVKAMLRRPRTIADPLTEGQAAELAGERAVGGHGDGAAESPGSVTTVPAARPAAVDERQHWLSHNGLRLQEDSRLVELDGEEIELTQREFDLLCALMTSGRRVRDKSDLALLLRGDDYTLNAYVSDADRRSVEVHVSNLRRKLGDLSASPRIIETVRGVGYRLTAPGTPDTRERAGA